MKNTIIKIIAYYLLIFPAFLISHFFSIVYFGDGVNQEIGETINFFLSNFLFVLFISSIPLALFLIFKWFIKKEYFNNSILKNNSKTIFVIIYLLLLLLTQSIGSRQIENNIINKFESIEVLKGRRGEFIALPWYNVKNHLTVLPFIICIEEGYVAAPLAGEGENIYYLWFLGFYYKLVSYNYWIT